MFEKSCELKRQTTEKVYAFKPKLFFYETRLFWAE